MTTEQKQAAEMSARGALLKTGELLTDIGPDISKHHHRMLVDERDRLVRSLHVDHGVAVVELARLSGLPWTSVLDILHPSYPPLKARENSDG